MKLNRRLVTLLVGIGLVLANMPMVQFMPKELYFPASMIVFYISSFTLYRKYRGQIVYVGLLLALPLFSAHLIVLLSTGALYVFSTPHFIYSVLGIFSGYCFYKSKSLVAKGSMLAVLVVICVFTVFWGYHYWFNFYNYGSPMGGSKKQVDAGWVYTLTDNDTVQSERYRNKLVVLDFFTTYCAVCFEKFPIFQEKIDKYKQNANIEFAAVNIPWGKDTAGMAEHIFKMNGCKFPLIVNHSKLDSVLGVNCYPTVLILKNNKLLFRGSIEDIDAVVANEMAKR